MKDTAPVRWDELRNVVMHYPVDAGETVSHESMAELGRRGFAVRDKAGRWIPTAAAVERFSAGPRPGDTGTM